MRSGEPVPPEHLMAETRLRKAACSAKPAHGARIQAQVCHKTRPGPKARLRAAGPQAEAVRITAPRSAPRSLLQWLLPAVWLQPPSMIFWLTGVCKAQAPGNTFPAGDSRWAVCPGVLGSAPMSRLCSPPPLPTFSEESIHIVNHVGCDEKLHTTKDFFHVHKVKCEK